MLIIVMILSIACVFLFLCVILKAHDAKYYKDGWNTTSAMYDEKVRLLQDMTNQRDILQDKLDDIKDTISD